MLGRITTSWQRGSALVARGRHVAGGGRPHELEPATGRAGGGDGTPGGGAPGAGVRGGRAARRAAERRSDRRAGRRHRLQVLSLAVTAVTALTVGTVQAVTSHAEVPRTRASFSTELTSAWLNDLTLGRTERADQYAQANVSGLVDDRYSAGFRLRYADRGSQVLVAVSGTGWLIQPSGGTAFTGSFVHEDAGLFRAEIEGRTVRVRWNGQLVATRTISGKHSGQHVVSTVRQPAAGAVRMASIAAASLPKPQQSVVDPWPGGGGAWLSGAAGDEAARGTFGSWRGSAVRIGGTWTDTFESQTDQWMICGGPWKSWNAPLDLAVGAIYRDRGENWAAAARGAYTARWTAALTRIKTCWGSRDQKLLYLRFAHEMNLASSPWAVRKGQEADFVAAMTLFSNLRYTILPGANLVFCPNDGTDGGLGGLDPRTLWPGVDAKGRRVAQVVGADSYNAWPHVTTAAAFRTKLAATGPKGEPVGLEAWRLWAQSVGAPFAVPEWSNNGTSAGGGGGGESPVFVQQFNAWARAHGGDVTSPRAGQLLYEVHFNLWTQYRFWPSTVQPRTAAAYRSLPWGQ